MELDKSVFSTSRHSDAVRIVPLGGCGEFGMNLTAFHYGGRLFVVDAGVRFPEPYRLGVDAIIPDVDPWFAQAGGVYAYLLTHGHEDHIGAMPHILRKWPAPVYGTAWTIELLRNKLIRQGLDPDRFKLNVVAPGDHVVSEGFDAEYVHINHSIPMACSLCLRFPNLTVFHTGDFKFEKNPIIEPPADFDRIKAIGAEGVDLLLADSTNAEKNGNCPGEISVHGPLKEVVSACARAVVITTFSSNLWRLKTIADICAETGRKLYITGGGLENTLSIASKLGIYDLPTSLRVADDVVSNIPRERLLVLTTGCQGERRAGLTRIASGEHRFFGLQEGDTVIWSSRLIPGNEKAVIAVVNNIQRLGVKVVTAKEAPGIHVSGHAFGGDVESMISMLKPRHFMPVHGAFPQLKANHGRPDVIEVATQAQLIESGNVIDAQRENVRIVGNIEVELKFVDSESSGLLSYSDLRDRLRIGELGYVSIDGVYDVGQESWRVNPTIELVGLGFPEDFDRLAWISSKIKRIKNLVPQLLLGKKTTPDEAREEVRLLVRRDLQQLLRKKPVVNVKVHVL